MRASNSQRAQAPARTPLRSISKTPLKRKSGASGSGSALAKRPKISTPCRLSFTPASDAFSSTVKAARPRLPRSKRQLRKRKAKISGLVDSPRGPKVGRTQSRGEAYRGWAQEQREARALARDLLRRRNDALQLLGNLRDELSRLRVSLMDTPEPDWKGIWSREDRVLQLHEEILPDIAEKLDATVLCFRERQRNRLGVPPLRRPAPPVAPPAPVGKPTTTTSAQQLRRKLNMPKTEGDNLMTRCKPLFTIRRVGDASTLSSNVISTDGTGSNSPSDRMNEDSS